MYQDRTGHSLWPTTVAIRDGVYGMYRHDGPSATKSPQYIPDEYGGNVSHNVVDMVKDVAQTIWNSNTIRAGLIISGMVLIVFMLQFQLQLTK